MGCVDRNNQLSGSYDEIGLLQGFVENTLNDDGTISSTATGNFFEAGTGTCVTGNFAIEGSWENSKGFPIDFCLTDTQSKASYLRRADNARLGDPLIEGYFEGTNFLFGKVTAGTWYEEESAGPIIYFVRNTGNLEAFRWSGLLGDKGRTVIDPSQIRQEEKHQNFEWVSYQGETTGRECSRFKRVKTYLLDNLPQDDDDFYYFVNDDYFDEAIEPVNYLGTPSSGSSVVSVCATLLVLALVI